MTTSLYLQLRKQNLQNFAPLSLCPRSRHNFQRSCPNFQPLRHSCFLTPFWSWWHNRTYKIRVLLKLFLWQLHYICSSENKTCVISNHFDLVRDAAQIFSLSKQLFSKRVSQLLYKKIVFEIFIIIHYKYIVVTRTANWYKSCIRKFLTFYFQNLYCSWNKTKINTWFYPSKFFMFNFYI